MSVGTVTPVTGSDWRHVAVRFDGTHLTLFVDGAPAKQTEIATHRAIREALGTGRVPSDSIARVPVDAEFLIGSGYPGLIDEVRLYDVALTDEQIARIHAWRPE